MNSFADLAPWTVHSLGASPFPGYWCFNPSVVRIPATATRPARWLCSVRCANYHLPGSAAQPARDGVGPIHNRILILELDPATWSVTKATEVANPFPRMSSRGLWAPALGFEDLRLVWTLERGLLATASAMRLSDGVLEIVELAFSDDLKIRNAWPLRGAWSGQHQKNWSPFAECDDLRVLYSPLGGGVHDRSERIVEAHTPFHVERLPLLQRPPLTQYDNGALEVSIKHGRVVYEKPAPERLALRGGSQLVEVAPNYWLGIAHGCQVTCDKFYWHRWYAVDFKGELLALSEPFKLSPKHGIEFAAGLAMYEPLGSIRDPSREARELIVSFGIEDDSSWLGVTELAPVLAMMTPVERPAEPAPRARQLPLMRFRRP